MTTGRLLPGVILSSCHLVRIPHSPASPCVAREAGGLDQLGATAALRNENGTALPGRRQRGARDTVVAHDGVVAVAVDVQVAVWAEDEADARRGQPAAPGRHEVSAGLTRARQR